MAKNMSEVKTVSVQIGNTEYQVALFTGGSVFGNVRYWLKGKMIGHNGNSPLGAVLRELAHKKLEQVSA